MTTEKLNQLCEKVCEVLKTELDENYEITEELMEAVKCSIKCCIDSVGASGNDGKLKRRCCKYTKDNIQKELNKYAKGELKLKQNVFYKENCINYRGRAKDTCKQYKDTCELYTEIIAQWVLDKLSKKEMFEIKPILRNGNYITYDGTEEGTRGQNSKNSNRLEEQMATELVKHHIAHLDEFFHSGCYVFDKQIPLKDEQEDDAGKIDLIAYDSKKRTLHLFELKTMYSTETMLRCVLEIYTYYKILYGEGSQKLLSEVKEKLKLDHDIEEIKIHPLVSKDGEQMKEYKAKECVHLRDLMKKLDIIPYCYECKCVRNETVIPLITNIEPFEYDKRDTSHD